MSGPPPTWVRIEITHESEPPGNDWVLDGISDTSMRGCWVVCPGEEPADIARILAEYLLQHNTLWPRECRRD